MFEPAKNSKAPDCSEALILLGGECRSRTGDLLHAIQVFYILLFLDIFII
jgi:hypothetical protein